MWGMTWKYNRYVLKARRSGFNGRSSRLGIYLYSHATSVFTIMAGGGAPIGPSASPLGQAWGYGIVLGVGFLFALGMIVTTWVLKRYNNELQTSEMFSTAGRTVKSGLVASAVVSSWTWAATLLQSSSVAFRYGSYSIEEYARIIPRLTTIGVSGPFWYASGATVQILLFATVAIELKRRAPNAHVRMLRW